MLTIKPSEYPQGTIARIDRGDYSKGLFGWREIHHIYIDKSFNEVDAIFEVNRDRFRVTYIPWEVAQALIDLLREYAENFGGGTDDEDEIFQLAMERASEK